MKVFKYEESQLVKLGEANRDSNEVKNTEVESFLAARNFALPNKLDRGDIYWALTPYRYNEGKTCKPHPVMVIEDFGLNYDTFAKKVEKKDSENKENANKEKGESKVKKEDKNILPQNKENNSNEKGESESETEKEYEYISEKFNVFFPKIPSFYDSFSRGEEPVVLVYVLTTTLIDSLCLGLDAQYKPVAPTSKFPLPFFKKDNLKEFGYIELFKDIETANGITKAFAPLLISKRTIFDDAGEGGSKAYLQSMDRFLFSRMIVNKDNWEKEEVDEVLKGRIAPVGECLIEPKDFDNSGFWNNPEYKKETVTYVRNPLRIQEGEPEKVTVTIPIIKDLQRSIIFAKYRKKMLGEKDLFPCWPDDLWGELKESKVYDKYGNPDISSANPIIEKSRYRRRVEYYKPEKPKFDSLQKSNFIPADKKYEDLPEKKVEFIRDNLTVINGKPKLVLSRVYSAEKGRENIFRNAPPNIWAWIPTAWEEEAREERRRKEEEEKRRREEEERKRKEEEERRKREEEERRKNAEYTSEGKFKIKKSAMKTVPTKKVVKIANSKDNPSIKDKPEGSATSGAVPPIEDEKVEESKEYSFAELRNFLESF